MFKNVLKKRLRSSSNNDVLHIRAQNFFSFIRRKTSVVKRVSQGQREKFIFNFFIFNIYLI